MNESSFTKNKTGNKKIKYPRTCKVCLKSYKSKNSFCNHKIRCMPVSISTPDHIFELFSRCKYCFKGFKSQVKFTAHENDCSFKEKALQKNYSCPECFHIFHFITELYEHLRNIHGFSYNEELKFENINEFNIWLENESTRTYTSFIKMTSNKYFNGKVTYYYRCQFFNRENCVHKPITDRRIKKGTIPTDINCHAKVTVLEDSVGVTVKYFSFHSHELSYENTKFHQHKITSSQQGQHFIPAYMKLHLREYNDFVFQVNKNKVFFTNVAEKNEFDYCAIIVNRIKREIYNPILIYKEQGYTSSFNKDQNDKNPPYFILGLQNKQQKEIMVKGSEKILCIECKQPINELNFLLINLFTCDQFNFGCPVAHFIINNLELSALRILFQSIKSRIPDLKINFLMTQDEEILATAAKEVFGSNITHILCTAHVQRTWKLKLNHAINDSSIRQEIYTDLIALLTEEDLDIYCQMRDIFISSYQNTIPSFMEDFKKSYLERETMWAQAYRFSSYTVPNINYYAGQFNNRLKSFFISRKIDKRIDSLTMFLLNIEQYIDALHHKNL